MVVQQIEIEVATIGKDFGKLCSAVRSATSFNSHTILVNFFCFLFLSLLHIYVCVCGYANKDPKTKAVIYTPISPTHLSP